MATESRPSLTRTIEERYATQRAGGTFNVKDILGGPGQTPSAGTVIDSVSANGQQFQSPNGFAVKATGTTSQFKDVQANSSKLSKYLNGFDNRPYKR